MYIVRVMVHHFVHKQQCFSIDTITSFVYRGDMPRISTARVGKYIREQRLAQGLTLEQLATLSSVHRNTLLALEHGRSRGVTLETVDSVCRGLRIETCLVLAECASGRGMKAS